MLPNGALMAPMSEQNGSVFGIHAPPPRPTLWAAFLVACGISLVFLSALGVWTLFS